jgi:hypothetical protein
LYGALIFFVCDYAGASYDDDDDMDDIMMTKK